MLLSSSSQQQQRPLPANLFDEAQEALDASGSSTEDLKRQVVAPPSDHERKAAACAVYRVTYQGWLGGLDAGTVSASDSGSESDGSSSSDEKWGASQYQRLKGDGGKEQNDDEDGPQLLGLPWIVAADVLTGS